MVLVVKKSFACYDSLETCEHLCNYGKCYFADLCHGQPDVYYCSVVDGHVFIYAVFLIAALVLVCFCIHVLYLATKRRRHMQQM
ncbi:hypothetical protein L596_014266 [Steinernema carpocapsae]|uniref:Uncharacterized protein n=1 Tax=Steinernema carpocapsae TaxID=34508 RepID=A0A4U5NBF7_STECR|nr:hypothetical protein L596_014266 [Steinernema carpocapsae]